MPTVPNRSIRPTSNHVVALAVTLAIVAAIAPQPLQGLSNTVVISQIYGGGGNAGSTYKNDFIELYNRGTTEVNLTGWSIQYASAAGTSWQRTNLTGTIQPGHFFLVQEAQGAGGTQNLPTPDTAGTIAMSATAGKVALVSNTTTLTGTCPLASSVDFVGYGSTASCFETAPTPNLSNTTAAVRKDDGATETDNNASDFTTDTAPLPRNSVGQPPTGVGGANPATAAPGEEVVLQVAVTPGKFPDAGGITVATDLTPIGGSPSQSFLDNGLDGDAVAGDNIYSFRSTLPAIAVGPRTLTAMVSDELSRSSNATFVFTVETTPTPIHQIQGNGSSSTLAGNFVTTSGIVSGQKNNGFFVQTPDADADGDVNTSEGIFVFTGGAPPPAAAVGNFVKVSGTVTEFIPPGDPFSFPITEIGGGGTPAVGVRFVSSGHALSAPVMLTAALTDPSGPLEQLERFESMRVHVDVLRVVAPTQGSVNEHQALSTSNGIFYGVIDGVPRPFREPGVELPDPLPPGSPCCVPRFDANPERLRVDSDAQPGAAALEVTTGALVSNLTGPLDYAFRTYTILPDPTPPPVVSALASATPVPLPDANEFTVGSFNIERFFDTIDDPAIGEPVLTTTAFNNRLQKTSLAIRNVMRSPDIIGVAEVENLPTLQAIANRVNSDAVAAGGSDPMYQAYLVEGNDVGGIDSGFLVKASRVTVVDVVQEGAAATFVDPTDGSIDLLNDRPPLVLRATLQSPLGTTFPVTAIVNHLRSLSGIDGADGERIRAKRRAQAEFLASLIQARQAADSTERIVSLGDYNAFQFNDGYVDTIGTIKGMPTPPDQVVLASSDLVNPNLTNAMETRPADERYSFLFDGNAQTLDHILVNAALVDRFSRFHFARNDADFPESFRNDSSRPERISDHDMPVAYFFFHKAPVLTLNGANPMTVECGTTFSDPGATATDETLGDLTAQIQVTGSVNANVPGSYTLTYSVTNGVLTTTMTRTVNVVDTTAPAVTQPTLSIAVLSPANHRLVDVGVAYVATDACDPSVTCALTVSSNEAVDGVGDGDTSPDWEIVSAQQVRLRAERAGGGSGRIYTITVTCQDATGNTTVKATTVAVPRDRR